MKLFIERFRFVLFFSGYTYYINSNQKHQIISSKLYHKYHTKGSHQLGKKFLFRLFLSSLPFLIIATTVICFVDVDIFIFVVLLQLLMINVCVSLVIRAVWGFITLCDSDCMFKLNGHFHPQEDTLHWVYTAQRHWEKIT